MKLYRDAAPDWFTDADLKSLVIKLEYNTAHINAAIQRLWDDSGQVETEWESQDKKKSDKKKVKKLNIYMNHKYLLYTRFLFYFSLLFFFYLSLL